MILDKYIRTKINNQYLIGEQLFIDSVKKGIRYIFIRGLLDTECLPLIDELCVLSEANLDIVETKIELDWDEVNIIESLKVKILSVSKYTVLDDGSRFRILLQKI